MEGPRVEGYDPAEFGDLDKVAPAPFVDDTLGIRWDLFSPDRVEAHLEAGAAHHQPYGIVHGGVYCGVVETLASVAAALRVLGDGNAVVGVHNATDFIRAHRTGRLDAVATPVHVGRTQHLWEVVITRAEDGKQVARGQVRLQVISADQALAGAAAQSGGEEDGA